MYDSTLSQLSTVVPFVAVGFLYRVSITSITQCTAQPKLLQLKYPTGQSAISDKISIPKFLDLYRRDHAVILKIKSYLVFFKVTLYFQVCTESLACCPPERWSMKSNGKTDSAVLNNFRLLGFNIKFSIHFGLICLEWNAVLPSHWHKLASTKAHSLPIVTWILATLVASWSLFAALGAINKR